MKTLLPFFLCFAATAARTQVITAFDANDSFCKGQTNGTLSVTYSDTLATLDDVPHILTVKTVDSTGLHVADITISHPLRYSDGPTPSNKIDFCYLVRSGEDVLRTRNKVYFELVSPKTGIIYECVVWK